MFLRALKNKQLRIFTPIYAKVKTLKLIVVCLRLTPRLKCDRNSNMLVVGHATKYRSQQKEII